MELGKHQLEEEKLVVAEKRKVKETLNADVKQKENVKKYGGNETKTK